MNNFLFSLTILLALLLGQAGPGQQCTSCNPSINGQGVDNAGVVDVVLTDPIFNFDVGIKATMFHGYCQPDGQDCVQVVGCFLMNGELEISIAPGFGNEVTVDGLPIELDPNGIGTFKLPIEGGGLYLGCGSEPYKLALTIYIAGTIPVDLDPISIECSECDRTSTSFNRDNFIPSPIRLDSSLLLVPLSKWN